MADDFYKQLTPITRFIDITNSAFYTPAPDDWYMVLSDVRGSTKAIQAGRYKEVNIVGAATIIALLNLDRELDLPYVFGGDGATVLIPPRLAAPARPALLGVRALAQAEFDLELRTALVPVADVLAGGKRILVARVRLTEDFDLAAFTGGGLAYVEKLVKDPVAGVRYTLAALDEPIGANLEGLECRWEDIPSRYGETVTLLVTASGSGERAGNVYREVITQIEAIYGENEQSRPIDLSTLQPAFAPRKLMPETKLRAPKGWLARQRYLWTIWAQNRLLPVLVRNRAQTGAVRWDRYLELLVATSDYRKYDDTLRMILNGTAAQREALTAFLEERYRAGDLAYGQHISDRALMTCVVFERMGRQVHFMDGADGGYALAARELKERLSGLALLPGQ